MPSAIDTIFINAGDLTHRVTFQKPGTSQDTVGQRVKAYTDVIAVWASVAALSGADKFYAAQVQSSSTFEVVAHWSSAMTAVDRTWRIKLRASPYRFLVIDTIDNVEERNFKLVFGCTEGLVPA